MNIDQDLVEAAQRALGTSNATQTVHEALTEVVNRRRREKLLRMNLPHLTPEALEEQRQNRSFGPIEGAHGDEREPE